MSLYDSIKLIVNIILIMIVIIFVIWFLKQIRISKLNKRINIYTISSNDNRHSLTDIIVNFITDIRKKVSKSLSRIKYIKKDRN